MLADNLSSHPIEEAACSKSLLAWEVGSVADWRQSVELPMLPINGVIVILVTFVLQLMMLGCIGAWSPHLLSPAPFGLVQSLLMPPDQRTRGARWGARIKSNGGRDDHHQRRKGGNQKEDGQIKKRMAQRPALKVSMMVMVENGVGSG